MRLLPSLRTARARLTLWNVGVLALVLLILGGVLRVNAERNLMASVDREIRLRARRHQVFWEHWPPEAPPLWVPRWPPSPSSRPGSRRQAGREAAAPPGAGGARPRWETRVVERLFNMQAQPVYGMREEPVWDQEAYLQATWGRTVYTTRRIDDENVRIFTAPLYSGGKQRGVVQIGYALSDVNRALGNLNRTLLTLIPVALAIIAGGGLFLTGRMLRPVREVTQTAARIGAEDMSRRLTVSGQDEFSELAATFNAMLGRLERAFEQQRRFTADASHELRTPLTVIKANTSLALSRSDLPGEYRKVLESVDRAAGVMIRIVQDLLLLARSDAGQLEIPLRPTRLQEVLETAVECSRVQGGAAVRIVPAEEALLVQGDASHLVRLFTNLLDNALRYTPADGRITLTPGVEGEKVTVAVADTGIGIPPEHLPHVCERFYRVDTARARARGGTGLGLSICHSIVQAHGGSMEIASAPGTGTTVRVTLRRASERGEPPTAEAHGLQGAHGVKPGVG